MGNARGLGESRGLNETTTQTRPAGLERRQPLCGRGGDIADQGDLPDGHLQGTENRGFPAEPGPLTSNFESGACPDRGRGVSGFGGPSAQAKGVLASALGKPLAQPTTRRSLHLPSPAGSTTMVFC